MSVTAALSWFDESPTWLAATVASCARFCSRVVAVDGAYELYPDARASSGAEQHEAIVKTAEALGMGVTVHVPGERWRDGEIAKRDFMMRLGSFLSDPGDWLFVIDADEVVTSAPDRDLVEAWLEETEHRVATVTLGERVDHYERGNGILPTSGGPPFAFAPARRLMRCDPTLRVEDTHYRYLVTDEEGASLDLWDVKDAEPAERLDAIRVEHRNRYRDPHRAGRAKDYYRVREALRIEALPQEVGAA